jgi:hypothetical protein
MRLHAIAPFRRMARCSERGRGRRAGQRIAIAVAAAAFVLGLAFAVIAILRAGISREEADRSLLADPATASAKVTRCLVGLYVRTPGRLTGADPHPDSDGPGSAHKPPARPGR